MKFGFKQYSQDQNKAEIQSTREAKKKNAFRIRFRFQFNGLARKTFDPSM